MKNENELKVCSKCKRLLPLEQFRLYKGAGGEYYRRAECRECTAQYARSYSQREYEKSVTFSENLKIDKMRQFKEISNTRILNLSSIGLNIELCGEDEIFVKLMDYKDMWLSNYGRAIRQSAGAYSLLNPSYVAGKPRYSAAKNIFEGGEWKYKYTSVYAAQAVAESFLVNEDKANNIFLWHKGYDKADCYYKKLYPLNRQQYDVVRSHYKKTGDDSEEFILKVMNDIRYKPDIWSIKMMQITVCGVGYHGILYKNNKQESFRRWKNMINRCYNGAVHERQPGYEKCTVCAEWLNYSNFKLWYDENIAPYKELEMNVELDKDILIKGNTVYSPETACLVPKFINDLFIGSVSDQREYPPGVYFDKDKQKYRACMSFMGSNIKLGTFDSPEAAFFRYKEYKEDFIKDIAEQYRGKLPDKVYRAMMERTVEVTD